MKITVKIQSISILEKAISVKMATISEDDGLQAGILCLLTVGDRQFIGRILSVTRKDGRCSLPVHFDIDMDLVKQLHPYQYQDRELVLLSEEQADPALRDEACRLLSALSVKEGRGTRELLEEITVFRPGVTGRPDLRFVSEKQMAVVVDKMRQRLQIDGKGQFADAGHGK